VPELPEVEIVRRGLQEHICGRTIDSVQVLHPRAVRRHVLGDGDFAAALRGRSVDGTRRRGKYLWLRLGDDALLAHLGMSGQLVIGPADRPLSPHVRARFVFRDDGPDLRFTDQRTFGSLLFAPGHQARAARSVADQRGRQHLCRRGAVARPAALGARG